MDYRSLIHVAYFTAFACLPVDGVFASQCVGESPTVEQKYENYDHVFVAKFTGAHVVKEAPSGREMLAIEFLPVEVYKGDPTAVTITASSGINIENSNFRAIFVGAHYLIFASKLEPEIHVGMCSPSEVVMYEDTHVSQQIEILRTIRKHSRD
jgi:hypothetical protein